MFSRGLSAFVLALFASTFVAAETGRQHFPESPAKINHNGAPALLAEPPNVKTAPPEIYNARDIDLPFLRLFHGYSKYFSAGELNTPNGNGDKWGPENDNVNQSACAIPDNAFFISKVAIHPYFLKYAPLDRYCMQDVCISFWNESGHSDMMLKVTDICSTDENDPSHCATPYDIKIDRTKSRIMQNFPDPTDPHISGHQFPGKVWWFFMKCWDDGIAQPAYLGNNWFTTPVLPSNLDWAQSEALKQYKNNQESYPKEGWELYPNGGYNTQRYENSPPINDWVKGKEPDWTPIPGGVGWGKKRPQAPQHDTQPKKPDHSPNVKEHATTTKKEEHQTSKTKNEEHHASTTMKEEHHTSKTQHGKDHHASTMAPSHTAKPKQHNQPTTTKESHDNKDVSGHPKGYTPETTTKASHGPEPYGSAPTPSSSARAHHSSHRSHHKTSHKTKTKCSSVYGTAPAGSAPTDSMPAETPAGTLGETPAETPSSTAAGSAETSPPADSPPADSPPTTAGDVAPATQPPGAYPAPTGGEESPSQPADTPPATTGGEAPPSGPTDSAGASPEGPLSTQTVSPIPGGPAETACDVPVTVTLTNYVTVSVSPPPSGATPAMSDSATSTAGAEGQSGDSTMPYTGMNPNATSTDGAAPMDTTAPADTAAASPTNSHVAQNAQYVPHVDDQGQEKNCTESAGTTAEETKRRIEPRYIERHKRRARSGGRRRH